MESNLPNLEPSANFEPLMANPKASVDAFMMEALIRQKSEKYIKDFTIEELNQLVNMLTNPSFGVQSGEYGFYCKHCGRNWNFEKKEDKSFFERFHKISGCIIEFHQIKPDHEIASEKDLEEAVFVGRASKDSNIRTSMLNAILNKISQVNNDTEQKTEEPVPSESETPGS